MKVRVAKLLACPLSATVLGFGHLSKPIKGPTHSWLPKLFKIKHSQNRLNATELLTLRINLIISMVYLVSSSLFVIAAITTRTEYRT